MDSPRPIGLLRGYNHYLIAALVMVLITAVLYFPLRDLSFWQDDFNFLYFAKFATLQDLFRSFLPQESRFFYRPLTTQIYFYVSYHILGEQPMLFRGFNFLLHAANGVLVYAISYYLFRRKPVALFVAVMFVTSRINFESLAWISGIQELGVVFFSLITILIYCTQHERWTPLRLSVSTAIAYIPALMSKESAVAVPAILFAFEVLVWTRTKHLKESFSRLVGVFCIASFYFLVHLFALVSSAPVGGYTLSLGLATGVLEKFRWGIQWSLNAFIFPIQYVRNIFLGQGRVSLVPVFLVLLIGICIAAFLVIRKFMQGAEFSPKLFKRVERPEYGLWGIAWFFLGALPIILVMNFASYYFMLPMVGLCIFIGWGIEIISGNRKHPSWIPIALSIYLFAASIFIFQVQLVTEFHNNLVGPGEAKKTLELAKRICPNAPSSRTIQLVHFPSYVWWDAPTLINFPGHAEQETPAQAAFRSLYMQPDLRVDHTPQNWSANAGRALTLYWQNDDTITAVNGCP